MEILRETTKAGYYNELMPVFHRALGQYAHTYKSYKIGSTHNPNSRQLNYLKDKWLKMVVIYKTKSRDHAAIAETFLIEYAKKASHSKKCWNKGPGGIGLAGGYPNYYIYVLLDKY